MFDKLKAFYNVFKIGEQVANPVFWKQVQSKGQPALAALLVAVVGLTKGTKYEIPVDDDTLMYFAGGVFAVTNWVLTNITSKKMGLPAKPVQDPLPILQPELAPVEDHSFQSLQPLSKSTIDEGLSALARDRGRANRDKPLTTP